MKVRVELWGELREMLKRNEATWSEDLDDGTTIGQLAERIGLTTAIYGAMIDGKSAPDSRALEDGSKVTFYLPMIGG